jgi:hypothetical protein
VCSRTESFSQDGSPTHRRNKPRVDSRQAHEWRTDVVESTMQPPGGNAPGSQLRKVALVAGRQVTTDSYVDTFEPFRRFTFEHVSGPLSVSGEFAVGPRLAETRSDAATLG